MDLSNFIAIREDWPKKGISFKDITPLLQNADAFAEAVKEMIEPFTALGVTKVLFADARGFIFGGPIALALHAGMSIARKPNKLPYVGDSEDYGLEYGENTLQIAPGAVVPGDKVLIVDDLLATGGTVNAACKLVERSKGKVVGMIFAIELVDLNGRELLKKYEVESLLTY